MVPVRVTCPADLGRSGDKNQMVIRPAELRVHVYALTDKRISIRLCNKGRGVVTLNMLVNYECSN